MTQSKAVSRIAELRKRAGLTQLELSTRTGVTQVTIQNWESGRVGIEQIERVVNLCAALGCQAQDLIQYLEPVDHA